MSEIGEFLKGRSVLVTGATGFVGSNLTRRLLGLGASTRILVRSGRKQEITRELIDAGAEVIYGDITDRQSVFNAVNGVSHVFHIAALFREAKHADDIYFKVNVEGVRNVLDAVEAHAVERLVHCSTIGVHSHIPNPPANEEEPYHPTDVYQESKCQGEKLVRKYFAEGRVRGAIIRPAMIWGEGDTRVLKLFRGVALRRMPIIGAGNTFTHWVHIHDLVNGFILAAEKEKAIGQVYIIAGKTPVTLIDLMNLIARMAGVKPPSLKIPVLPIQLAGSVCEALCKPFGIEPPLYRRRADFFIKNRAFDTSKAQRDLGFMPRGSLEDEVQGIFNWYKQNGWLNA